MANTLVNQNLLTIIRAWETFVNHASDLVFTKTLYHDLQIIADMLPDVIAKPSRLNNQDPKNWRKALIVELRSTLQSATAEIFFMQAAYPTLFTQLCQATIPDAHGMYDVHVLDRAVSQMLTEFQKPSYLTNLHGELVQACFLTVADTEARLTELVRVLLVRLVELASQAMLKKHTTRCISQSFLALHHSELEAVFHTEPVQAQLTQLLQGFSKSLTHFVHALNSAFDLPIIEKAQKLANTMLSNDRLFSARVRLFFMQSMFDGVVVPLPMYQAMIEAATGSDQEQSNFIEQTLNLPFWTTLSSVWVDNFAELAISWLLHSMGEATAPRSPLLASREPWIKEYQNHIASLQQSWTIFCTNAADGLVATNLFEDWDGPRFAHATAYYRAHMKLQELLSNNLEFDIGQAMASTCTINFDATQRAAMGHQLGRVMLEEILKVLRTAIENNKLDPTNLGSFDDTLVLNRFGVQSRIMDVLMTWFASMCERFLISGQVFGQQGSDLFLVGDCATVRKAIVSRLVQHITTAFNDHNFRYIQHQVQDHEVDHLLRELIRPFQNAPEEYTVIGIIDGLDLRGANLNIGGVRVYDARDWDYGEGNTLDVYSPWAYRGAMQAYTPMATSPLYDILDEANEYKGMYGNKSDQFVRHSARAVTTVQALDAHMAQATAALHINQVLDILTWGSLGQRQRDASPQLELLPYFIIAQSDKQLILQLRAENRPRLTQLNAEEQRLAEYAQTYNALLSRPVDQRTPVEQATVRAVHWLSQGYWEPYQADQFINYWIALEQLLVDSHAKLAGIQDRLPKLVATWDRTDLGQQVLQAWKQLVKEINGHPDIQVRLNADPQLTDWAVNALVLLQRVPVLEQADPTQALSQLPRLKALLDPAALTIAKTDQQANVVYKVRLLNKRRNTIVHEGISYSPDMHYFIDALWKLVNFAVERVAQRVFLQVGNYHTIDDIIQTYDTPW